jgi:hypothetical protein
MIRAYLFPPGTRRLSPVATPVHSSFCLDVDTLPNPYHTVSYLTGQTITQAKMQALQRLEFLVRQGFPLINWRLS